MAGWDPSCGEYRATVADCCGHAEVLSGQIAGDRLVFASIGDPPVRLRLTRDLTDPEVVGWRNEVSVAGGPWTLVGEYRCTPVGP